jgi:hypothetical protein
MLIPVFRIRICMDLHWICVLDPAPHLDAGPDAWMLDKLVRKPKFAMIDNILVIIIIKNYKTIILFYYIRFKSLGQTSLILVGK